MTMEAESALVTKKTVSMTSTTTDVTAGAGNACSRMNSESCALGAPPTSARPDSW